MMAIEGYNGTETERINFLLKKKENGTFKTPVHSDELQLLLIDYFKTKEVENG